MKVVAFARRRRARATRLIEVAAARSREARSARAVNSVRALPLRASARLRRRASHAQDARKAEAQRLPRARHHDSAPMMSPTRVASHATDRKPKWGCIKVECCNRYLSSGFRCEPLRPARAGDVIAKSNAPRRGPGWRRYPISANAEVASVAIERAPWTES